MVVDHILAAGQAHSVHVVLAVDLTAAAHAHVAHDDVRSARRRNAAVVDHDTRSGCSLEQQGLIALQHERSLVQIDAAGNVEDDDAARLADGVGDGAVASQIGRSDVEDLAAAAARGEPPETYGTGERQRLAVVGELPFGFDDPDFGLIVAASSP